MASVKPHGKKWRAAIERHGMRPSKVFATEREAWRWARQTEAEIDALKMSGGQTFGAAIALYLETITPMKRSEQWERNTFARLAAQFGEATKLGSIDTARIGQWRNERMRTVTGSTVQREANLLRNLFLVARDEWRWIDHNPFRGVRLPEKNSPRSATWTWPLIRRVLRADRSGKTAQVIRAFHLSLHTGLRLQEALSARYDARARVLTLPITKTGKAQLVPVTRRAARVIERLLPTQHNLTDAQLRGWSNEASALFSKLLDELLIDGLTFHDARASALTWLSRRMDVLTLARISRHKNLQILLNTYYRETAEQIAARL